MIDELKTDYKDDVLATSQQGKRTFNIVGKNGEILFEDVHIEDTSRYLQVGDEYGGDVINETNEYVNQMDDKLDELIEFMDNGVKAEDVTYNDSNVKLALDTLGDNLGSKSSASEVTGNDAFSKIATLNSDLSLIGVTKIVSVYISKQQTVALAPSGVIFEDILEIGSLTTSIQPLHMWNTNNGQMYKAYANSESGRFQAGENIPIGNYIVIGTLYVA